MRGRARVANVAAVFVLLFIGLALGGCAAHRLAQAQDAFSKAAEQENRLVRLEAAPLSAYASPYGLYQQADAILRNDTEARAGDLRNDQLLATAYALHAMTLWRLTDLATLSPPENPENADPPAAKRTGALAASDVYRQRAREARKKARALANELGPRDQVIMEILPSLMDHDAGMHHFAGKNWRRAHDFFQASFTGVQAELAAGRIPEGHDIRRYLRMVQMQTLVAWHAAHVNGLGEPSKRECREKLIIPHLKAVTDELKAVTADKAAVSAFIDSRLRSMTINAAEVERGSPKAEACSLEWVR